VCYALQVGLLSSKTRLVRVKNVLTEQEDTMEVPSEETVGQVRHTAHRAAAAALQARFPRCAACAQSMCCS
jgi:hypothetical protein